MGTNFRAVVIETNSTQSQFRGRAASMSIDGNECREFAARCGLFIIKVFSIVEYDIDTRQNERTNEINRFGSARPNIENLPDPMNN